MGGKTAQDAAPHKQRSSATSFSRHSSRIAILDAMAVLG